MNEDVVLWYETDARSGTPTLKVHSGKPPFDGAELDELDREVRARYDRLARGTGGPHTLRSHHFDVEVQHGPNQRQPKLVLRLAPTGTNGAAREPTGWTAGFFEELRRLFEGAVSPPLAVHEKGSLATVVDELRAVTEGGEVGLSAVLLAGYLATAEQHCRERDAARAGVYVLALRGLSRFLAAPGEGPIASERLVASSPAALVEQRPPTWLSRFFGWITGAEGGGEGPR